MSKEAMKMALEALETERDNYQDWDKQDGAPEYIYEAITALREALAEQPAKGCDHCNHPLYVGTKCKNCGRVTEQAAIKRDLTPEQPAQQEPVAVVSGYYGGQCVILPIDPARIFNSNTALYTSPPAQRKPLTDEEIEQCMKQAYATVQGRNLEHAFARAIEAAHGIKGEA